MDTLPDYKPETIDELIWMPSNSDDGWEQNWYGLEIEDGGLYAVTCDVDGNWESDGLETPATEEGYQEEMKTLLADADRLSQKYHEHVRDTGEDPLGVFYTPRTRKKVEKWTFQVSSWIGVGQHGLAVIGAMGIRPSTGKWDYMTPDRFPDYVADFIHLKIACGRWVMDGITWEDVVHGEPDRDGNTITCEITREIKRSDKIVKLELQAAARRLLKIKRKAQNT